MLICSVVKEGVLGGGEVILYSIHPKDQIKNRKGFWDCI